MDFRIAPRLALAAALCAVAVLAACGGAQRGHKKGDEYVGSVRIEGNHAISSDDLLSGLAMTRQISFHVDDYQVALDATRISGAYQRLGYFGVEVDPRVDRKGDIATVVFKVTEGKRATVKVEFVGLPADVPVDKARKLVGLADGAPFDYDAYDDAKLPLLQLLLDSGYAHAHMEASVIADRVEAQATLRYLFDPGPLCTFGDVKIDGVTGLLAEAALARVEFKKGDRYSAKAVTKTQNALYGLGLFATARVDLAKTEEAVIPVTVTLARGKTGELKAGFGLGLDPETIAPRLRLQITQKGIIDDLTTGTFDARPAIAFLREDCTNLDFFTCPWEPRIRTLVGFSRQDFFRKDLKAEVEGGFDFLTVEAYTQWGARGRVGLSSPLGVPWLQGRVGWMIADYHFYQVAQFTSATASHDLKLDTPEHIGGYTAALVADLRDQPLVPTRGIYAEVRGTWGTVFAGSGNDYVQLQPDLRGYVPLWRGVVLAGRARWGVISGDIPPTERFYGGGVSGNRGFPERRLSPFRGAIVNNSFQYLPVGGGALFESSAELRTTLFTHISAIAFLDAGDVTETYSDLDYANLHYSVGVGLGAFTPIGPIGIDVARKLDRYETGEPDNGRLWNILISIGEAY